MSNLALPLDQHCTTAPGCNALSLIIEPRDKDLGGFSVRRCLPSIGRKSVGPWVFFDHMGPATMAHGPGLDVRPHPHVNLATVTYLFEGEILHRDSLGSVQVIRPGDINLMVAGRGIVHSERERPERTAHERRLHGLQLWLALPQADEEAEPAFHHYPGADIPALVVGGVPVRVLMGSAFGVSSPVKAFAQTLYVEAELQPGQSLALPHAPERAVYVAEGGIEVDGTPVGEHAMAVLATDAPGVVVRATARSRIAVIGGENVGKRFIDWNFVSSRKERIEQARSDWVNRRFPSIPGDDTDFIPLPQ